MTNVNTLIKDFEKMTIALAKDGEQIKQEITPEQAKIDELQKQVITQGQNFNDQAQKLKDTEYFNQKLQARIDEALRFYNEAKSPHNIGMIQMAIYLKGNKDEN